MNPRQLLTAIYLDAVAAADPELAVRRSLKDDPLAAGTAVVIASGKAAVAMTRGFADAMDITRGMAVTTIEEQAPVPVIMGGHPEPNPGSVAAARRALELAASAGPGVTVVYLVSGGSSALLALPAGELTLDDLVATNRLLLASGADIAEVKPGSAEAERLKAALIERGLWSQYLEVGIGPYVEVFSKASPMSAVGVGEDIGLHPDSVWNNPEPETVLVVDPRGRIVGAYPGAAEWDEPEARALIEHYLRQPAGAAAVKTAG